MSFYSQINAHYKVSVAASKIEMFATENDTDLWAVAVDGFFELFKTKTEADKFWGPKNAKCKISDFTPINIKDYITKL